MWILLADDPQMRFAEQVYRPLDSGANLISNLEISTLETGEGIDSSQEAISHGVLSQVSVAS